MDIRPLRDPLGRDIPPEKSFLVDAFGNPLSASDKDFVVPPVMSVSSIISGAQKTYLALDFDEALRHSYANSRAMWRDCRIQALLDERVDSVVNLKWHLKVEDETDPVQKAVKDGITRCIRRTPRLKRLMRACLKWALWGGRGGAEMCWRWESMMLPKPPEVNLFDQHYQDAMVPTKPPSGDAAMNGMPGMNGALNGNAGGGEDDPEQGGGAEIEPGQEMEERAALIAFKHIPINGDSINYMWGWTPQGAPPGTPIYRVHATAQFDLGQDCEIIYDNRGPNVVLDGDIRERFIIHTHDPDPADYFAPEMAGGIYGVGIRSRIYWVNWIRQEYASWIQDLYDRVGLGFICIKYDQASAVAKKNAETAAKQWNRRSVLAIPVTADQLQRAGSIEVVEVPVQGAVLVQELCKWLDMQIERYILHHTIGGSSGTQGDGQRGTIGPAEMAKNAESQRIQRDAEELAETLTGCDAEPGLISTIKKWTYPGADFPVWLQFEIDDAAPDQKLKAATMVANLGVKLKADEIRSIPGFSKPDPGDETIGGDRKGMGGGFMDGQGGQGGGGIPGAGEEEQGGGGNSPSNRAAREYIAMGKARGSLTELAKKYGITKQAVAKEALKLQGRNAPAEKTLGLGADTHTTLEMPGFK